MYISRVFVKNFRNFSELDISLSGNAVIVGENRVGKSNFLYALRLVFDPSLSDSQRQLGISDYWDGIGSPSLKDRIVVQVEIKDFETSHGVLATLTDYRLTDDPHTVRLNYEFRPNGDLQGNPVKDEDFEFICFGGENESNRFGHDVRRSISMELLPALRDAERELGVWKRSPLRPLIERASETIRTDELEKIKKVIDDGTKLIGGFKSLKDVEDGIRALFSEMAGPKQDIGLSLGFSPTDMLEVIKGLRLFIDGGRRTIHGASLGSANVVYLALKILVLQKLIKENKRLHTLFAIEESEAHLHPHLQRSIYKKIFEDLGEKEKEELSIFLTTHSPHIASVAPLRSLVILREEDQKGTKGYSSTQIPLDPKEIDDLSRYLDVTRAEMLFSRGVLLVEGDAEKFLLPVFAETVGFPLDVYGISVCSVSGTNFEPYVKFLTGMNIPFAVITDWDPIEGKEALGCNRVIGIMEAVSSIKHPEKNLKIGEGMKLLFEHDPPTFFESCDAHGLFTNDETLELEMLRTNLFVPVMDTLLEHGFGRIRSARIQRWKEQPDSMDGEEDKYMKLIEEIGKGRFAQRLAANIEGISPPAYIELAIKFVAERV